MERGRVLVLAVSRVLIASATVHVTFQTTPTSLKTNGRATTTVKRKTRLDAWVVQSVRLGQVPLLITVRVPFHSQKNQPTFMFLMLIFELMLPRHRQPGTSVPPTAFLNQVKMELSDTWFTSLQARRSVRKMLLGTVTQLTSTLTQFTLFRKTT